MTYQTTPNQTSDFKLVSASHTLLIDEGNSRTKYALLQQEPAPLQSENNTTINTTAKVTAKATLQTPVVSTTETTIHTITEAEFNALKPSLIKQHTPIIFASVKSAQDSCLKSLQQCFTGVSIKQIFTPKAQFGLVNAYQAYERLGVDRWLAMLGGMQQNHHQDALIVIDAGTAVTIDLVGAKDLERNQNAHLGGWILPNVQFCANSLAQKTGKIELKQAQPAGLSLGKSTESCVYNGLYASHIQLIKSLYVDLKQVNKTVCVYIAGGDAELYQRLLVNEKVPASISSELVFRGMALYTQAT